MCGITGYFLHSSDAPVDDVQPIRRMSAAIAHRGPDDEGFVLLDSRRGGGLDLRSAASARGVTGELQRIEDCGPFPHDLAMAHRRFSIIDLSPGGHQPMWTPDRRVVATFNGEILNYRSLRSELSGRGRRFRTGSDTEVLLAAFQEWDVGAFERFEGFFAIALFVPAERRLVLCRDRIGKKPIYLYEDGERVVWASEIKALLALLPDERARLNEGAVRRYLHLGLRDHGHETFWSNFHMMGRAEYRTYTDGGEAGRGVYWSLPAARLDAREVSVPEAGRRLERALREAIELRLVADVPISSDLSGGLDSSALVALRATMSDEPFPVFSVRYEDPAVDETPYARMVAARFPQIEHVFIDHDEALFWDQLEEFVHVQEEPFHNPNILVNQNVRRQIRAAGYPVYINGAGGDEVLAGYPADSIAVFRQMIADGDFRPALENLVLFKEGPPLRPDRFARRWLSGKVHAARTRFRSTGGRLLAVDEPAAGPALPRGGALLRANMGDLKMNYWQASGDKMSMGVPIEGRAPFLDHRVVELGFQLPLPLLTRGGWLKWVLRDAMRDLLPPEVVWRRNKMGFPFPLRRWLSAHREAMLRLLRHPAADRGWIDQGITAARYEQLCRFQPEHVWRASCLHLWYLVFVQGAPLREVLRPGFPGSPGRVQSGLKSDGNGVEV